MKPKGDYKVRVTIGDATIDVEGAEAGIVKIIEALGDILRGHRKISPTTPSENYPLPPVQITHAHKDIRSFFGEKSPTTDVEAAAVAAYYYKYVAPELERQETISPSLLQEAFRLARRPLPRATRFTLQNARNAGYLDSTGDGQYRLNPVGYNLVEHALAGKNQPGGVERQHTRRKSSRSR